MSQYPGYFSTSNTTKWQELRELMLSMPQEQRPRFRSRHMITQHLSRWDSEWFYHFSDGGYRDIAYIELSFATPLETEYAARLEAIGLSGRGNKEHIRIFGYVADGTEAVRLTLND